MTTLAAGQYRLRASSPMPTRISGYFVLHSFMAEYNDIDVETCTTDLPSSTSFRGQGGEFTNASFSQLPYKGGRHFQGKLTHNEVHIEEGSLGFN